MNCPNCNTQYDPKNVLESRTAFCLQCNYQFLLDDISKFLFPDNYQRPELTSADKATAEKDSRALIKKYGYNNLPKILAALAVENVRLVKEIQEHRAARGIDPLPVFEV